nr:unnamed protein product [Spirometra erinaceieuropaei]
MIRSCPLLNEIRLAREIKDLTIEVKDNSRLHAHRIILAARIPSLRAELSDPLQEKKSICSWTVPSDSFDLMRAEVDSIRYQIQKVFFTQYKRPYL